MEKKISCGPRAGTWLAPPSKSQALRVLLCDHLAGSGTSAFRGDDAGDILAMRRCLAALEENAPLPCGESASTLRFLLPVVGARGRRAVFLPEGNLPERPLAVYAEELRKHGMKITWEEKRLCCEGRLMPGTYRLPGDVSSQFFSGLLFALPLLADDSELLVEGELQSADYARMTEESLVRAGIRVTRRPDGWHIPGGQTYNKSEEIGIEGDWSAAAVFLCMGALSKEGVCVRGLSHTSAQGDRRIVDFLEAMGAQVERSPEGVCVRRGGLRGITVDARETPDLISPLAALASAAEGETRIVHAERLRGKETDRIRNTVEMLRRLGADIEENGNGIRIIGRAQLSGGATDSFGDHRIAFGAAVAACACREDVVLRSAECVSKSYPAFWAEMENGDREMQTSQTPSVWRSEIDRIDDQITDLFTERMKIAEEIADYKKRNDLPIEDAAREEEIQARLAARVPEGMRAYLRQLYKEVFALSKRMQEDCLRATRGLLGESLGHSYSPQIHALLGNGGYRLFEKSPAELESFLLRGDWDGLNVTIPYKKAVAHYCGELSPDAARTGSVNTLVRRTDGRIFGDNTDVAGFRYLLQKTRVPVRGKKVLVLGSGGASAAVCAVLTDAGAEPVVIRRSGEDNYGNLERHRDAKALINTTPVGMHPKVLDAPVSLGLFSNLEFVIDVIYNPARTELLLEAEARGIPSWNGLPMLVAQARRSAELFEQARDGDGNSISRLADVGLEEIEAELAFATSNLVLIGMPGAGKSAVARELGRRLGREVFDTDAIVTERTGKKAEDILRTQGEESFRKIEAEILQDIGLRSGAVIATGGGCVTRTENYASLRRNGRVFWIRRKLADLSREGRPLSQGDLAALYEERRPLYEHFADEAVDNEGTPEETARKILALCGRN